MGVVSVTATLAAISVHAEERRAPTEVSVDRLGKDVVLIGRLGFPLAQMMIVRGT